MKPFLARLRRLLPLPALLLLAAAAQAERRTPDGLLEAYHNLDRAFLDGDRLSAEEWDAQSFDSGSATVLRQLSLNLYREDALHASGTYWVRIYDDSGPSGSPGTNAVATVTHSQPIASLAPSTDHVQTFFELSVPLVPNRRYYVVVGTHHAASGLRWGFTNDPVGANGFPSIFTFTSDAGKTWRTPFTNALPQRMTVLGDDD